MFNRANRRESVSIWNVASHKLWKGWYDYKRVAQKTFSLTPGQQNDVTFSEHESSGRKEILI